MITIDIQEASRELNEYNRKSKITDIAADLYINSQHASKDEILGISKSLTILSKRAGIGPLQLNSESIDEDPYLAISVCQEGLGNIVASIAKAIKVIWIKLADIIKKVVGWIMDMFKSTKIKNDLLTIIDSLKTAGVHLLNATETGFKNLDTYAAIFLDYIAAKYKKYKEDTVLDETIKDNGQIVKNYQGINNEAVTVTYPYDGRPVSDIRDRLSRMVKDEAKLIDMSKLVNVIKSSDPKCTIDKVSHNDIFIALNTFNLKTFTADVEGFYIDTVNGNSINLFKLDNIPILSVYKFPPHPQSFTTNLQRTAEIVLDNYNVNVLISKDLSNKSRRVTDYVNGNFINRLNLTDVAVQKQVGKNMKIFMNYMNMSTKRVASYGSDIRGMVGLVSRVTNNGTYTAPDMENEIHTNFGFNNVNTTVI